MAPTNGQYAEDSSMEEEEQLLLRRRSSSTSPSRSPGASLETDLPDPDRDPDAPSPHPLLKALEAFASFRALISPVFLTMLLTVGLSASIRDQVQFEKSSMFDIMGESGASGDDGKNALTLALTNATFVVVVICCVTFAIVACIKYNCRRVILAYILLAFAMVLGLVSSALTLVVLQRYYVPVDAISFSLFFYNFAAVGVLALFAKDLGMSVGFPKMITHFYLICVSVVEAVLLVNLTPSLTLWALLVMVSLYDLCAVLTPCGPLQILIQQDEQIRRENPDGNVASMPSALLYEAEVPYGTFRNGDRQYHRIGREEEPRASGKIRLGLGDFVFYSVLTSKAAEFGFVSATATVCSILLGAAFTIVLHAIFEKQVSWLCKAFD